MERDHHIEEEEEEEIDDDIESFLPLTLTHDAVDTTLSATSSSLEVATRPVKEDDPITKEPEIDQLPVPPPDRTETLEQEVVEPNPNDVLTGRGAHINLHPGNQKFRALCYAHKAIFDAANPAAKRRIATEIWNTCQTLYQSRFLSKQPPVSSRTDDGPWIQQSSQKAIFKAAQTIRDYQRPDRRQRHGPSQKRNHPDIDHNNNNHRHHLNCGGGGNDLEDHPPCRDVETQPKPRRTMPSATPMDHVVIPPPPLVPVYENPDGVEQNDVLCGRGAFVNGHRGNQYLRELAMTRKCDFDAGNYTEKRRLATEIVTIIQQLQPPGRFLTLPKAPPSTKSDTNDGDTLLKAPESAWEEVSFDKAILKACQVMRDINRPDRKYRVDRKLARLNRLQAMNVVLPDDNGTTSNNDPPNVVEIDTVMNDEYDNAQQPQQQQQQSHEPEESEPQQQPPDIGVDSVNGINSMISDVVDSLTIPIDRASRYPA